jgi:Legionella pneumophila major outer membrane protein precursor
MNKFFILLSIFPALLSAGFFTTDKEITPIAVPEPCLKDLKNVWFDADVLLWQASEDGLNYAIKSDSQTSVANGRVQSPDFDFDWGVRLGLGIKLPHDQWDLLFTYTYAHAHGHGSVSAPSGGAVFPVMQAPFGLPDNAFAEHARFRLDAALNMGDIELGRNCVVGKHLNIRPFMGVRGLSLDQDIKVQYTGGTAVPVDQEDRVRNTNDFWGVGLRMGADTLWGLGAGWGIYGNGAASLVSGSFTVREKEKLEESGVQRMNLKADQDSVIAIAELALGIQWDHLFSKDRYHFGFKFGWEFNVFFDQNRLIRFINNDSPGSFSYSNGDFSFQGLTFGFRFDF